MFGCAKLIKKVFESSFLFVVSITLVCSVAMFGVNALEFFGLRPCAMCKIQRFIVFFIMISGLSGLFLGGLLSSKMVVRLTSHIVCFGVFCSFAFAVYQFGVEKGFFAMPAVCSQGITMTTDMEVLLHSLPAPPCNKAQLVGPFSIGEYTLVGTGLMFLTCLLFLFVRKKADKDGFCPFVGLDY